MSGGKKFSFQSTPVKLDIFGENFNSRKMLRGLEAKLRVRTGMSQISVDFLPSGRTLEPMSLQYTPELGYKIYLQPMSFVIDMGKTESEIANYIIDHSHKNQICSVPPPIPGTIPHIEQTFNFDTRSNKYDAIAHDGGCLIAFYTKRSSESGVVMRNVPALGIVHYQFQDYQDYQDLIDDADKYCSAFLDLSSLSTDETLKNAVVLFLRTHQMKF